MITEEFRVLVQDEGRGTKNSIAFNVPLNQAQLEPAGKVLVRKPPTSPRALNESKKDDFVRPTKRSSESLTPGSRVRSASTGRDKKSELQARYWAFLFGNLQRAVDEIYQTCETDESVSECKEVILVLDNYTKDFHNLIEWFKLKWEYENTPPPQRPTSYAWEIRKSSSGKIRSAAGVESNVEKESVKFTQVEDSSNQLQNNVKDDISNNEKGCAQSSGNETQEDSKLSEECKNLAQQNKAVLESPQDLSKDNIEENISLQVESEQMQSRETCVNEILVRDVESNLEVVDLETNDCDKYKNNEKIISDGNVDANVVGITTNKNNENLILDGNVEANVGEITIQTDIIQNSYDTEVTMKDVSTNTNGRENPLATPSPKDVNIETEINDGCVTVVHQASQTDLELCVESSDGLHFVSVPQNEPPPMKLAPTLATRGPTSNSRPSPRIPTPNTVRPTTITRPAYSTVSRLSGARPPVSAPNKVLSNPTKLASSVSRTVPRPGTTPRGAPNVRLVRSRTSADVRSTGRSHIVLRPITDVNHKLQRTSTVSRQAVQSQGSRTTGPVRTERQTVTTQLQTKNSNSAPRTTAVMTSCNGVENSCISLVDGSNSSLNSSASCDKTVPPTTMSIEVLPRSADDDDTQGWEMVKGRSRTRMSLSGKADYITRGGARLGNRKSGHFHLRFHQPSAASSLPALALAEVEPLSCKSESTIAVNGHKVGRQNSSKSLLDKRKQSTLLKKNNSKDVKALNLATDAKLKKSNKLVDEAVTSGSEDTLVNSPHATVSKSKSINNGKLKSGESGRLSDKVIRTEDDVLLLGSKLDDMLDEKCLFNEDELRKSKELSATEEKLRKEIHELESIDIEVDTETDETETDGEATVGTEDDGEILHNEDPLSLEARYEPMLQGMSGLDRVNVLEQLQEFVARHPGRALELHQKLSSPSRRRTLTETLRRLKDKQEQAEEKREKLRHERSQRIRELLNKVEEVKTAQAQLIEDKRVRLEMKLKRAEVNRKLHLKGIVRKAHDEEEKLKEIAFINELEAQNKRHDFMAQCQEQEERLQGIHEERQRKQEEKAAKEAAVEERRRVLEAERQERLEKMQELRRKREERVGRKQLEREKERQELAREKARDREERLSALHAAQLAVQEELQKKIQQKQEDSARRHEENIEHIRQRALESSILRCTTDDLPPRLAPYETLKLCELCNVLIGSEVYLLSHLRGKQHQESVQKQQNGASLSREELLTFSIPYIVDAPADKIDPKIAMDKERQKALKKRCKKIRLRMSSRGQEYESKREVPQKFDSPNKARLMKCLRDVDKLHSSQGKGQWPNNAVTSLERALGEINRLLGKKNNLDQEAFQALNGFSILSNVITLAMEVPPNMAPFLPAKCYVTACTSYILACQDNKENCKYVLFSNKVSTVLDLLLHRLTDLIPDRGGTLAVSTSGGQTTLPVDNLAGSLMKLLALVLTHAATDEDGPKDDITIRIQDVISYTVSVGVVDRLAAYCSGVRDPIDSDTQGAAFLLAGLELLSTLAARCCGASRAADGGTQLTCALQVTELVGAVSMLYGALLRQGAPPRGGPGPPPPLPPHTAAVALATFKLLARVAELHLPLFQSVLGAEGISLQFRHIASYLLWHCSHNSDKELLHEVVRVVGFFAVRNADNQMMLQSGFTPTVLQQLCGLPFPYFSNPALSGLLFPTLLACCSGNQQNKAILEQELSYQLLEEYKTSEAAKSNRLVALLDG